MGRERVIGYDVARALALLGMIVVHNCPVTAAERTGPDWLLAILHLLDGRAAAIFAILAGIGATLMTRSTAIPVVRAVLVRRGVLLLALGFVNLIIWPGDILRMYGISLVLASRFLRASSGRLLLVAAAIVMIFALLYAADGFFDNWDWPTLTYRNTWTTVGLVRNTFFDGFRSVLPWSAFVIYGMALGRLDLTDARIGGRVLLAAVGVAVAAELSSRLLLSRLGTDAAPTWCTTVSLPALPLFVVAAGGAATTVIALCARLAARWPGRASQPLAATGQMGLTWYLGHILIGAVSVAILGRGEPGTLLAAASRGVLLFGVIVPMSWAWKSVFRHGPLEWAIRVASGRK